MIRSHLHEARGIDRLNDILKRSNFFSVFARIELIRCDAHDFYIRTSKRVRFKSVRSKLSKKISLKLIIKFNVKSIIT